MRGTLLLIILNAQSILSINKYCLICKTHTLCKYTKAGPSEKCVDYRNFSLTSENKTDIKDAHNILRNVVASGKYMNHKNIKFPKASAMNLLKWNEELSWIAQRWADQCPSERNNDECRNIQDYNVGQNIYSIKIQSNNIPQYSELLQAQWSAEEKKFTIEDSTKFDSLWDNKLKSFSQSIWDTVQYIGCGVSSFKINEEGEPNTTHTLLIVCNFAPAGNIPNFPIYKLGAQLQASVQISQKTKQTKGILQLHLKYLNYSTNFNIKCEILDFIMTGLVMNGLGVTQYNTLTPDIEKINATLSYLDTEYGEQNNDVNHTLFFDRITIRDMYGNSWQYCGKDTILNDKVGLEFDVIDVVLSKNSC